MRRSEFCKKHTKFTLSFSLFSNPAECPDCLGDIERERMMEQQFADDLNSLSPYIKAVMKNETQELKDLRMELDALKASTKKKESDNKPKFKMFPHPQPKAKKANANSSMMLQQQSNQVQTSAMHDDLSCQVCMNLVNDPKQCSVCDKLYCSKCIHQWLK